MLPSDIDPASRCRLPLVRREDLDEDGQAQFDTVAGPGSTAIRGLVGPGGVQLHSPQLAKAARPVNRFLRFGSGLTAREREVAILTTARECDSRFEWAAHEDEALRAGAPAATIEAIKHRRPLTDVEPEDALIIQLGREAFGLRRVSPETYRAVVERFGPERLVNLVVLMGNYASTAMLLTVVDMQLDDDATAILPLD